MTLYKSVPSHPQVYKHNALDQWMLKEALRVPLSENTNLADPLSFLVQVSRIRCLFLSFPLVL